MNGVTQIAAGGGFTMALRSDGTVWAWGWNGYGEIGNGSYGGVTVNSPSQVQAGACTACTGGYVSFRRSTTPLT